MPGSGCWKTQLLLLLEEPQSTGRNSPRLLQLLQGKHQIPPKDAEIQGFNAHGALLNSQTPSNSSTLDKQHPKIHLWGVRRFPAQILGLTEEREAQIQGQTAGIGICFSWRIIGMILGVQSPSAGKLWVLAGNLGKSSGFKGRFSISLCENRGVFRVLKGQLIFE